MLPVRFHDGVMEVNPTKSLSCAARLQEQSDRFAVRWMVDAIIGGNRRDVEWIDAFEAADVVPVLRWIGSPLVMRMNAADRAEVVLQKRCGWTAAGPDVAGDVRCSAMECVRYPPIALRKQVRGNQRGCWTPAVDEVTTWEPWTANPQDICAASPARRRRPSTSRLHAPATGDQP